MLGIPYSWSWLSLVAVFISVDTNHIKVCTLWDINHHQDIIYKMYKLFVCPNVIYQKKRWLLKFCSY
jgi:hypothetical protein